MPRSRKRRRHRGFDAIVAALALTMGLVELLDRVAKAREQSRRRVVDVQVVKTNSTPAAWPALTQQPTKGGSSHG